MISFFLIDLSSNVPQDMKFGEHLNDDSDVLLNGLQYLLYLGTPIFYSPHYKSQVFLYSFLMCDLLLTSVISFINFVICR